MPTRGVVRPGWRDGLMAAGLVVVVVAGSGFAASVQDGARSPDLWAWLWAGLAAGSLAWWRAAPVAMLAGVAAGTAGYLLGGYAPGPVLLCLVVATFQVARVRSIRTSLGWCAAAAAVVVAALLFQVANQDQLPAIIAIAWVNWMIVPWSLGTLVQVRTVAARRVRAELVERGALEERMRVAREVHDVAGHGFSVIAMQAGVALLVLDDDPGQVRESLEGIRATSTEALGELRVTLGTIQAPSGEAHGLGDLPGLARRMRGAGLVVDLQMEEAADLPKDLDAAAYRVVQESLTNVLRHAGPARARVRVAVETGELLVEICDDGTGPAAPGRPGGQGLTGMRSRVEAMGGGLSTGPRDGGGFRVAARIPLPDGAGG